ncbi:MAG: alpha/beta fold hydrolase, partial [Pseudomonadota bacterium]
MNHPVCILISVFAVIACAACSERGGVKMPAPPPDPNAGVARYELQRVMAEPLIGEEGAIAVKETPDGDRLISIGFRRFRSTAARPSDPVFLLPGGPGGSYNERLDEDGDRQAQALALVELFRRVGDVVLVDLRGVYLSTPHLVCDGAPNKLTLIKSATKLSEITRKAADACRSKLLREGVDLAGYTPIQAAQDVIAVADHLGYENIRLYGRSFGSHWALTLAKYFPERISRMVIEGVEGLDHTYDDHHSVLSAIERISADAKTAWSGFRGFNEPVDVYRTVHKNARASSRAAYGLDPLEVSLWMLASHDHSLTARSGMSDWLPVTKDLAKGKAWPIKIRRPFIASYIGIGWDAAAVGLFDCASSISQARRVRLSLTNQESILYTD